jgi:hypothetical protein
MSELRTHRILVRKPGGKSSFGISVCKGEENIKTNLKEAGY